MPFKRPIVDTLALRWRWLGSVAFQVWTESLRYNPESPLWPNRDRFVLSCGHASMLLYSMIHLAGVKATDRHGKVLNRPSITLDNIKNFRQLHSPCAGHPEFGEAAGIETTTGPLGQGVSNSVGMAIASKWLAATYNRPGFELFDYDTYALCGDGDLMEGVAYEAASLAGHLKLSNLCWIYDDNGITIEGHTDLAFSENVAPGSKVSVGIRFASPMRTIPRRWLKRSITSKPATTSRH